MDDTDDTRGAIPIIQQERKQDEEQLLLPGVYNEDVVRSKDGKKIGIVLKTAYDEDSDESSDEEADDEEEDKVQKGQVLVAWYITNSKRITNEEIVNENTVELADRSILPGDVVRWREKSKGSQKAQIVHVKVHVDVKVVGTNYILYDLDAQKSLLPLELYNEGEAVVVDSWMGIIRSTNLHLTLRLKNGSRCVIEGENVEQLIDSTDQRDEDSTFYCEQFYPGQQVHGMARIFKDARWITGSRPAISNHGRLKAIVEKVAIDSLNLEWQLCGFSGRFSETETEPPPVFIDKANSGKLQVINASTRELHIQLGDKAFYVLTDNDVNNYEKHNSQYKTEKKCSAQATTANAEAMDDPEDDDEEYSEDEDQTGRKSKPTAPSQRRSSSTGRPPRRKRHAQLPKRKKRYQPPVSVVTGNRVCVEVCGIRTFADTIWQDGSDTNNIQSIELSPVMHLDEKEYFPGDFVVDKRGDPHIKTPERFGVVRSSNDEARILNICWLSFINSENELSREIEEDVSVYDIEDHKDYTFRIGDVVVRLATMLDKENDAKPISPAGTVIKVNIDGTILIRWVNETKSSVLPSQIFLIGNDNAEDDEFDSDFDADENDEDGNEWETASDASDDEAINEDLTIQNELQQNMNPLEDVIMRSLAALNTTNNPVPSNPVVELDQRTTDFLSALDHQFGHGVDAASNSQEETIVETDKQIENIETSQNENNVLLKGENVKMKSNLDEEASSSTTEPLMRIESRTDSFSTMDSAPSCHQFYSTTFQPTNQRTFNTAVMKELKLLKTHLPDGIIVKAFEDRMDLYSVLITGPRGTPYEDGLFYFDISLPNNYPAGPPLVHYHAYCTARLNPNLYEDGKVCVSLLGTWSGKGSETWTSKSTLHQVLTSIQGLILCEEPYYNEAGYEDHRGSTEGLENSRLYNEMSIVKMLQSIRHMINRPPEIFQNEVLQHFQERLRRLVNIYTQWLDEDSVPSKHLLPTYPLFPVSKGFQASVKRVLADLQNIIATWTNETNIKETNG